MASSPITVDKLFSTFNYKAGQLMKRKLRIEILPVIYNVLKNVLCILSDRRLLLRGFSSAKVSSMGNKDCKIYKAELERYAPTV